MTSSIFSKDRIEREAQTLTTMFLLYCQKQHGSHSELCSECQELEDYSLRRLEKCPFQQGKTTCAKCPIHCYKADMRARIRQVMRFSGPRMLLAHPFLTVQHYLDGRRKEPLDL
jgi:aldehyde:ferredoxin oxidoreductase